MLKVSLLCFGFDDYTIQLANSLADYVDLTLIHREQLPDVFREAANPKIRLWSFKKPRMRDPRSIFAMKSILQIIRESEPDVLHVQDTNNPWYDLTLLFNKLPPLVTTIHDVFRHPGDRWSVAGSEYTRYINFYRSQQLIVHTDPLKETVTKQFAVSPQRVNVIPHGELGSFYQRQFGQKHLHREPYTLLFFGRIWPYKGLKYLLEAMPLVAEHIPEVKLIIAGQGENLKQYFPDGYDEKRYEILNYLIPLEDIVSLFERSAVMILPYIEASQSGIAAISYGMGTPVIASNIGGLGEMIRHEQDGLLVPPRDVRALADAIIRLLKDDNLQQQMRTAMLARCQEDLNWKNIAAQTVEVYYQATKNKSNSWFQL
jgi:glycosyltransferase involved in cell wall biosynthesis